MSNRAKLRRLIASCLVLLYCAHVGYRHLEAPVLPPMRTDEDVTTAVSSGVSMAFPRGWSIATPPTNDGSVLSFLRPQPRTTRSTLMSVRVGSRYTLQSGATSLHRTNVAFLDGEATMWGGRETSGLSLIQNLQLAWKAGSFEDWRSRETHARWHIEFEHAGQLCSLSYSAPCGRFARVNGTALPAELLSYFETFVYEPVPMQRPEPN